MCHRAGFVGRGAWPGGVWGQPPCWGRKRCCWLYSHISSLSRGILGSPCGLTCHHSCPKSYRHLWVMYQHQAERLSANSPTLFIFGEKRRSACQPTLGRGLFPESDGGQEFRCQSGSLI